MAEGKAINVHACKNAVGQSGELFTAQKMGTSELQPDTCHSQILKLELVKNNYFKPDKEWEKFSHVINQHQATNLKIRACKTKLS